MSAATIGGRAASLEAAVEEAARILGASRCAVLGGLATDAAGASAAVTLARRIGGVIDHAHSGPLLRDLEAMRTAGRITVTPPEARARADLALLVGPGAAWPGIDAAPVLPPGAGSARRLIRLGPGRDAAIAGAEAIAATPAELPGLLGALRAITAGRPVRLPGPRLRALSGLADALKAARYGVASWSAAALDALAVEMLCGLIDDLNAHTRFAGLPVAPADNAEGVAQTCAALTGFPLRIGFGKGAAEHDPWRFDAARMIAAGEADTAIWIDALGGSVPAWDVNLVALTAPGTRFPTSPSVAITVARPGIDHHAVLFDAGLGTLVARGAEARSEAPPVADVLGQILGMLPC